MQLLSLSCLQRQSVVQNINKNHIKGCEVKFGFQLKFKIKVVVFFISSSIF